MSSLSLDKNEDAQNDRQKYLSYVMRKNPLENILTSLRSHCASSRMINSFGVSIIIGEKSFYVLRISDIKSYISMEKVSSITLQQKWERHCLLNDVRRYIIKHIPSKQQDIGSLLLEAHSHCVKSSDSLINRVIHLPADLIVIIIEFIITPHQK